MSIYDHPISGWKNSKFSNYTDEDLAKSYVSAIRLACLQFHKQLAYETVVVDGTMRISYNDMVDLAIRHAKAEQDEIMYFRVASGARLELQRRGIFMNEGGNIRDPKIGNYSWDQA